MAFTFPFPNWLRSLRTHRSPARKQRPRTKLTLETLEDRTVPATFMVTNTTDGGSGSLRQAILDANTTANTNTSTPDQINFSITAASDAAAGGTGFNATTGVATIRPLSALPAITDPVILDAT